MLTDWTIDTLARSYRSGSLHPRDVIRTMWEAAAEGDPRIWISRPTWSDMERRLVALEQKSPEDLPLYGIPFAIKDNIDLSGLPTTAGCPDYAYHPDHSAFVVQRLIEAGAIPMGKTNLDQFATGLVGVRSPYGIAPNAFDATYIPGGSSSGSAVAVALGLASFSLGTDTAGSGRVPAAFNNLVGMKPTRGLLSCSGVVPACRTLDCGSIFALTVSDAWQVCQVAAVYDPADAYARPNESPKRAPRRSQIIGVPQPHQLEFFGDESAAALFAKSVERLTALGHTVVEVDASPFLDAASLLYGGPWVAERYAAIRSFIEGNPEALHAVTHKIIAGAATATAVDAFAAQYKLAELRRASEPLWTEIDAMMLPTAGTIYTVADVDNNPIALNSNLGRYTNFMNLLDLAAWAVPAGFLANNMPWGVTFCAPAFEDARLAKVAEAFHGAQELPIGTSTVSSSSTPKIDWPSEGMDIAVFGAHLEGLPLNHQLTSRGGRLRARTRTAPVYRMHCIPPMNGIPARPGLVRSEGNEAGASIDCEIWNLPHASVGTFLNAIAAPLGLGRVPLEDGTEVCGFICEASAVRNLPDITEFKGWRAWLAQ